MKKINLCLLLVTLVCSRQVLAWGDTGHRVSGEIAEHFLSENAKAKISELFPHSSLAEISTFADEYRSHPSEFWQKTASPWHYVTVPEGKTYAQVEAPAHGDAITALANFRKTLTSDSASIEEKRLALHFTVHIIGDLHQPLHAGNGTDRGGNDVKLKFFWEDTNLHRVWDSQMIDAKKLSYTEWSDWLLRKIGDEQLASWQDTDPQVWVGESTHIRDTIYPESDNLVWDYSFEHIPTVKSRLQLAGVRIAAYLNELFAQAD